MCLPLLYMYYFTLLHLDMIFRNEKRPVFYVASRGHHADIGGITPGSMPPHSTSIQEEGAVFLSFKLVEQGVFQVFHLENISSSRIIVCSTSGLHHRNLKIGHMKILQYGTCWVCHIRECSEENTPLIYSYG